MTMLPDMETCDSSCLEAYGYEEMALYLTFVKTGITYRYDGVPEDVFYGLQNASSKGQYFQKYIRNSYKGEKV